MKYLVIIWSNGDREEIAVTEEYAAQFNPHKRFTGFEGWSISLTKPKVVINMEHARQVFLKE